MNQGCGTAKRIKSAKRSRARIKENTVAERNQIPFGEDREARWESLLKLLQKRRVERPDPQTVAKMKSLVEEMAERGYPDVWVGEVGMTAYDLLQRQELNEGLPEEMRLEPGELVQAEGTDGGIQIPEVGGTRLNCLDVVRYLEDEMDERDCIELWHDVDRVQLAQQGRVLCKVPPSATGLFHDVYLPLTADEVPASSAEDVIDDLEFHVLGGTGLNYVIPETERVKAFLAEHGEYFG